MLVLAVALAATLEARRLRHAETATPTVSITDLAADPAPPEVVRVSGVAIYSAVWAERHPSGHGDSTYTARWFYLVTDGRSAVPAAARRDPFRPGRDTAHVVLRAAVAPLPAPLGQQLRSDPELTASFQRLGTTHYLEPLAQRAAAPWAAAGVAAWVAALLFALGRMNLWTVFVAETSRARDARPPVGSIGNGGPARLTAALVLTRRDGERTRVAVRGAGATVRSRPEGGAEIRLEGRVPGIRETGLTLTVPEAPPIERGRVYERFGTRPALRLRLPTGVLYLTVTDSGQLDRITAALSGEG